MPENRLASDGRAEKPERGCETQRSALARSCYPPGNSGADGRGEVIRGGAVPTLWWEWRRTLASSFR